VRSSPGWFPDPGGAPGQFRYWDGEAWSAQTTGNPNTAPTPQPASGGGGNGGAKSKSWIIALGVVILATILVVVVILYASGRIGGGGFTPATEDSNSSKPSVSAWDETSTPTPSPTESDGGGVLVDCPVTQRTDTTRQSDGQIKSDTLVADKVDGWRDSPMYLNFSYDLHANVYTIYEASFNQWMSNVIVASLANEDGFVDINTSAQQVLQCVSSSQYYDHYTGTEVLSSQQIDISGYPAWWIQANVRVDSPIFPQAPGDRVDIIVVDLGGDKDHLGMFYGACTIGLEDNCALVDGSRNSLRVEG
jgi:hypothetical protein